MIERFGHLAQRMFNVPLAIHPRKAEVIMAALADRLHLARVPMAYADDGFSFDGPGDSYSGRDLGYDMVGPVAVIPVSGTLVQKTGSLRPYSGMTGYDGLRQAFLGAMNDDAVEAIAFDVDSPGGEVAGCFDLVDDIYGARGIKPIASILTENAFSAGYAIASAADPGRVFVPRTGGTGSVGILCMHVDWSRAMDEAGLKVTFIHYGAKKVDGHPEIALSVSAAADMQRDIDTMGELFVDTVARNRGLPASAVKAMEAGTYLGAAGVSAGLADAVKAPDDACRALLSELA
jgi:ClpP class serine protease